MKIGIALLITMTFLSGTADFAQADAQKASDRIVLEDFSQYPQGWKAKGDYSKANEIYQSVRNEAEVYLRARVGSESVRIFKKTSWDSKTFPIMEWKWRVKKWPEAGAAQVYMYIALDKDFFGIPIIIKYVWSRDLAEGTIKDGGFFMPTEVVIRSGSIDSGDWVIQRVNARADFKRIIGRDPKGEAYGIGMLIDPGMEVEFGEIIAVRE